jgi:hypothetical protein
MANTIPMLGGGNRKPAPMSQTASDGLSALAARLSGAKKNKPMRAPKVRAMTQQNFSKGTGIKK